MRFVIWYTQNFQFHFSWGNKVENKRRIRRVGYVHKLKIISLNDWQFICQFRSNRSKMVVKNIGYSVFHALGARNIFPAPASGYIVSRMFLLRLLIVFFDRLYLSLPVKFLTLLQTVQQGPFCEWPA